MRNYLFSCCLNIINFNPFILWYLIKGKIDRFKCFFTWSIWKIWLFLSLIGKSINNRFNEFVKFFGNSFLTNILFLCLNCGISRFLLKSGWLKSFITTAIWKIWFFFSFTWKRIYNWFYKFMNFFGNSLLTNILFLCLHSRICLNSGICRFLLESSWFKSLFTCSIWKIWFFFSFTWKWINNWFHKFMNFFGNSFLTNILFLRLNCRICLDRGICRFLLKSFWFKSFITAAIWKIWLFFSFTWKWINNWFHEFMNFFGNSILTNIFFLCLYCRICLNSSVCRFLLESFWFINPFVLSFFLNPVIFYSILCNWKMNFFMGFFTWTIGKIWLFFLFTWKRVNYRFYEFMKLFRNSFFTYIFFLIFGINYRLNYNFFIIYFIKL